MLGGMFSRLPVVMVQGWRRADWGRIVFSDESCLQLCPHHHRRRVWIRPGQCADPIFTIARHTNLQSGVMVWGAISFDSRTPLVVIRGTLTVQRSVDDILRTVLLPFLCSTLTLIFQKTICGTRVVMNCLTACQTLPWSARSPDLTSIEHVWDMMGRWLHLPGNVDDLTR
ncbi:transposable element Tc1 transposase [Trichonephila clavipes]|nr:transposable element Tc1 transposase [Trichonephila clavipes]